MNNVAVLLVLVAAVLHAGWNFLSKRSEGGTSFVWLFCVFSTVIYAPLALVLILLQPPTFTLRTLIFLFGSIVLHLAYFLILMQVYKIGDLSLVYPLARGTGPMFSTLVAILFLGERPTPIAVAGALLIAFGIYVLTGNPTQIKQEGALKGVAYALFTGLVIAGYTLWDKQAVSVILIPPLLLDWTNNFGRAALLTPYAIRHRDEVKLLWRQHLKEVIGVAVLSPLAYILILTALTFSPVSYVAPAREISTLIGAFLGVKVLSEQHGPRRLGGAGMMVAGVIGLIVG